MDFSFSFVLHRAVAPPTPVRSPVRSLVRSPESAAGPAHSYLFEIEISTCFFTLHTSSRIAHLAWLKSQAMQPGKQLRFRDGCGQVPGAGAGRCWAELGQSKPCSHFYAHLSWKGLQHRQVQISAADRVEGLQESQGCFGE